MVTAEVVLLGWVIVLLNKQQSKVNLLWVAKLHCQYFAPSILPLLTDPELVTTVCYPNISVHPSPISVTPVPGEGTLLADI